MTALDIPKIDTADLRSEALLEESGSLRVRLVGAAESDVMAALTEMLAKLHGEAVGRGVREVTIDIRELEFMNSSCFKAFVTWVGRIEELEAERQYQIRFLSDEKKHWQARSLRALTCFATHLIRVES